MKQVIGQWKQGDRVQGKVTEQLRTGELIISFQGDLLRVANESQKIFAVGDLVLLEIVGIRPIRFKLASDKRTLRTPGKFDISI